MITFVTFHVDTSQETDRAIIKSNITFNQDKSSYRLMINLFFCSISIFHNNCKKVVLTDYKTDLSRLQNDIDCYRLELKNELVMLSRLKAQIDFLVNHDFSSDIVFMDNDILVNKCLENVFTRDFNIGLTFRKHSDMPLNGAVIFVSKSNKKAAIEFFQKVYYIYQEKYSNYEMWWGDQYALFDAIERKKDLKKSSDLINVDGIKVLLLPCTEYNFSPENHPGSIAFEMSDKSIIHFKGERKKLMYSYWVNYLANKEKEKENFSSPSLVFYDRMTLLYYFLTSYWLYRLNRFISKFLARVKHKIKKTSNLHLN